MAIGVPCLALGLGLLALGEGLPLPVRWPFGGMLAIVGMVLCVGPLPRLWNGVDSATRRALSPYGDAREVLQGIDGELADGAGTRAWHERRLGPSLVLTKNWLVRLFAGTIEAMPLREIQSIEKQALSNHRGDESEGIVFRDRSGREMIVEWHGRDEVIAAVSAAIRREPGSFES